MITSGIRKLLFAGLLVTAGLLLIFGVVDQRAQPAQPGSAFSLQAPPFVNVARAAEASQTTFDLGAYLDQEAGISAYYKSPYTITLSQVRGEFRTIEFETEDFIIGSVAVPNHCENSDPHVYVHRTGWILAYYLRPDPVSKIVDVYNWTIDSTKLTTVVSIIANAAGAPFTGVTYYDFRYPNATNMLLVAEDNINGNDFTIQLPSTFGYFERGWALDHRQFGGFFRLDGVNLGATGSCNNMSWGTITASQLLPDVSHTILIDDFGVLIIVYRVP